MKKFFLVTLLGLCVQTLIISAFSHKSKSHNSILEYAPALGIYALIKKKNYILMKKAESS